MQAVLNTFLVKVATYALIASITFFPAFLSAQEDKEEINRAEYIPGFSPSDLHIKSAERERDWFGFIKSSPVIADIDGDLSNGKEVIGATATSVIYAYRSNGALIWKYELPLIDCTPPGRIKYLEAGLMFSSPAIGNLDGKRKAVVIGYGGRFSECQGKVGGLIALDANTGKVIWNFKLHKRTPKELFKGVVSTPALADIDGDGKLEIGFGSLNRRMYILNHDGTVRLEYDGGGPNLSSPIFLNIDKDPNLEMIIGYDVGRNDNSHFKTKNGGLLIALKTNVKLSNPYVFFGDKRVLIWRKQFDQTIWSSPVLGELISESKGAEIAIGSGCYNFSNKYKAAPTGGRFLTVLNPTNGKILRKLPLPYCTSATPAIADLDGDGRNEVVITLKRSGHFIDLIAFQPQDSTTLWTSSFGNRLVKSNDERLGVMLESPIVADLDGNGSVEVMYTWGARLFVFSSTGELLTCSEQHCGSNDKPLLRTIINAQTTPTAIDINGDGILDVMTAGDPDSSLLKMRGLTNFSNSIISEAGPFPPFYAPWPMWRGDVKRSGVKPE